MILIWNKLLKLIVELKEKVNIDFTPLKNPMFELVEYWVSIYGLTKLAYLPHNPTNLSGILSVNIWINQTCVFAT